MATFEFYVTGDQIGSFSSVSDYGNGNDLVVTLTNVQALGSPTDIFRIVVTQANTGETGFRNGQMVSVYTWSETNQAGTLVYSQLNPQDDMYQGRASGHNYQIFSSSRNVLIDLRGVGNGTVRYGSEQNESLGEKLPFAGFPTDPTELLPPVPCFVEGTRILTRRGPVRVEELKPGDRIATRGHGMQKLRWIGSATTCGFGHLAPVRFEAGVLGNDRPVYLSQQHRVLITGWQAQLHFGEEEVLVAALHLVDGDQIRLETRPLVRYWHLACDGHEIICADGLPAESLFPGPMAANALSEAAKAELLALFPSYFSGENGLAPQTARQCLSRREARVLQRV